MEVSISVCHEVRPGPPGATTPLRYTSRGATFNYAALVTLVDLLVWIGTLTFAATGALIALRKGFDLIGVLVLASVTAIGGGSIRDVIVGVLPPTNFTDEALLWVVAATALGFGAQWLTEWYSYEEQVKPLLNLASEHRVAGFFYIGSYKEKPEERVRPDLQERISYWGS